MIYFILIAAIIAIDQLTKNWAVATLMTERSKDFIGGFLGFRYTENTGAAFSILRDKQIFLILLTFLIILALLGYMIKAIHLDAGVVVKMAYVTLIAGAIGNLIDRIRLNYVIDFLEFRFVDFPIFNVADMCVVSGVILLTFATLFLKYDF